MAFSFMPVSMARAAGLADTVTGCAKIEDSLKRLVCYDEAVKTFTEQQGRDGKGRIGAPASPGAGNGKSATPSPAGDKDAYLSKVIHAIMPNWSLAMPPKGDLAVQLRIKTDKTGRVLGCSIEKSSGRPDYDASAVNAVLRTKTLPAPPSPEQQDMVITFKNQL